MVDDAEVARRPRARPTLKSVAFFVIAAGSAIFALRLLGATWSGHFPAAWPDAVFPKQGYLAVAAKTPFRPSFYFAFRPIGYPIFLWVLGRSSRLTVIAQTALYCGVVIALCATAARVLRSRAVAIATSVLFVGIAIQAKYAMWNTQILSESLAISLGLAALAAWWRFAAAPTPWRARSSFVLTIAFLVARDAHVLPTTVVLVPVALGVALHGTGLGRGVRRTLTAGAVVVMLTAGYSYAAQSASHRATLSFHNVVGVRVLPDPQLTSWFAAHGMPLDAALRTRTGKSGLEDAFYESNDPAFARYRHWARGAGPRALALSLAVLAPHYADLMNTDIPTILKGDVQFYDTEGVYNRFPRAEPLQLGGPTTRTGLAVWLALGGAAITSSLVLAIRRKRGLGVTVFGATALALTLVELYTTWGGDPVEAERHLIGAVFRLSVILVVVIASAIDAALTRNGASDG